MRRSAVRSVTPKVAAGVALSALPVFVSTNPVSADVYAPLTFVANITPYGLSEISACMGGHTGDYAPDEVRAYTDTWSESYVSNFCGFPPSAYPIYEPAGYLVASANNYLNGSYCAGYTGYSFGNFYGWSVYVGCSPVFAGARYQNLAQSAWYKGANCQQDQCSGGYYWSGVLPQPIYNPI